MLTETVDVQDIKTRLADLISLVQQGTEVILEKDDVPFARIVPITSPTKPRVAGLHRGAIWISDDFDDPLPEEVLGGDSMKLLSDKPKLLLSVSYCK